MARKARTAALLRVHCNPYASIDKDGFPAGQTRHDPIAGKKGQVHFIGASVKRELVPDEQVAGKDNSKRMRRGEGGSAGFRKPIFDFEVEHWLDLTEIADTEYHRRRLRAGELIAADEATARAAGLPGFVSPAEALKAAREKAIADWNTLYPDVPLPLDEWPDLNLLAASEPPAAPATPAPPATTPAPAPALPPASGKDASTKTPSKAPTSAGAGA